MHTWGLNALHTEISASKTFSCFINSSIVNSHINRFGYFFTVAKMKIAEGVNFCAVEYFLYIKYTGIKIVLRL